MVPLFRVTVAWEIKGKQVVRVYEARSPQQAWQAAVLEKIGIESTTENNGSALISVKNEEDSEFEFDREKREKDEKDREGEREKEREAEKEREKEEIERENNVAYESEDEEECRLRAEIRDQRRTFFRALRIEQRYKTP